MSSTTPRVWILTSLAGLSLVSAACAADPGVVAVSAQPTPTTTAAPGPSTPAVIPEVPGVDPSDAVVEPEVYGSANYDEVIITDGNKPSRPQDDLVALSFTDIERWWGQEFEPIFGTPFVPLEGGVYAGYPGNTTDIPSCGESGDTTDYELLQLIGAFYCQLGDFIAFDDGDGPNSFLLPIAQEFGSSTYGVVLAHEYGHAIQERTGVFDMNLPSIYTEQQADCYAGAWVGQSYNGESPLLRLGDADIRTSLLALLEVRDPVGISQLSEGGHGSAFDRVGAFEEGFVNGPARCAELIDDPLELIPNEFVAGSELEIYSEGNLPYACTDYNREQMIEDGFLPESVDAIIESCTDGPIVLAADLNSFWKTALDDNFPTLEPVAGDLGSYDCVDAVYLNAYELLCPSRQTVVYDGEIVPDLYREFGDFSLGYLLSVAWAEQAQIYQSSSLTGEERALLNDCYTGAWENDTTPRPGGSTPTARDTDGDGFPDLLSSSPGDLDEAIRMVILIGDEGANTNEIGTAFEKNSALRVGVLGGYDVCEAKLRTN